MTTASDIITAAYRESNLIALVASPTTAQTTEALNRLNSIILSCVGFEAGQELWDLNVGGDHDQSSLCSQWVTENMRLVLNLSAARTLNLDPMPYEGQRLAVADAGANLATYNLTLDGNGRTIEGAATLTLSTNGAARQWMYRADTANWVRITELASSDQMPLPVEFDDYFITMLAMRLNPRYGQSLADMTLATLDRQQSLIQARYRRPRPMQDAGSLGLLGQGVAWSGSTPGFYAGRLWL